MAECPTLQGGGLEFESRSLYLLYELASHALSSASLSLTLQELQKFEQFIFADHTSMIHVENVYEEILHKILLDETLKGEEGFLGTGGNTRYGGGPLQGDPGRPARGGKRDGY